MRRSINLLVLAGLLLVGLALPGAAFAHKVVESDELELQVNGLGEVAASAHADAHHPEHEGFNLDVNMARLAAKAAYPDIGGIAVQVEAASGRVELLDAAVEVRPVEPLSIKAGRFKVPVSREYLISAPDMMFSRRAALTDLVPHRAVGLQAGLEMPFGKGTEQREGTTGSFQLGAFAPSGLDGPLHGATFVARGQVEFPVGIGLHGAFAEYMLGENLDPETGDRLVADNRLLDAAVSYHHHHWHALAEGTLALDGPEGGLPWGIHGSVGRRFQTGAGPELEPALAYDFLQRDGSAERSAHRGTAALNVYWLDTQLMSTLEYEAEVGLVERDEEVVHAVTMLLQAGF